MSKDLKELVFLKDYVISKIFIMTLKNDYDKNIILHVLFIIIIIILFFYYILTLWFDGGYF